MTGLALLFPARRAQAGSRSVGCITTIGLAFVVLIAFAANAAETSNSRHSCAEFVPEAAVRFQLPQPWIGAVLHAESHGIARAVSSAGALGCMQIMPATWADVRMRLGLGADPFDAHDNVIAGAAYLRELLDRYGWPGALAAYNAGPNRYAAFLSGAARLPVETRVYVSEVAGLLHDQRTFEAPEPAVNMQPTWTRAPLFVGSATAFAPATSDRQTTANDIRARAKTTTADNRLNASDGAASAIFAASRP